MLTALVCHNSKDSVISTSTYSFQFGRAHPPSHEAIIPALGVGSTP